MIDFVALPLVVTLVVIVFGSRLLDQLQPAAAARGSVILLASVAIAAAPTLWLIGLSGLAHTGLHDPIIDWSGHLLPNYPPLGAIVGIASLVAALVGTARVVRVLLHHRRIRCTDTGPLHLVDTDEVYAYTLPGPAGTIAISQGLRNALAEDEYEIVMAHERAHARNRHDRFKLVALLTTALVPPTRSVATRLDHYIERWADEEAVRRTGVDRQLAARTIAKVALAASNPPLALGIADHGVAARAAALLVPEEQPTSTVRLQTGLIIGAAVVLGAFQLHHSVMFAVDLVP